MSGERETTKTRKQWGERKNGKQGCREPESIDVILKRWLKAHRVPRKLDRELILERWSEVVGEELAACTRAVDLQSGVLVVEVSSAPLLHELSTYYREALLESLRQSEDLGTIREIRFLSGTF